jgi:hypothetical protein
MNQAKLKTTTKKKIFMRERSELESHHRKSRKPTTAYERREEKIKANQV